jgi:hypothetical protein
MTGTQNWFFHLLNRVSSCLPFFLNASTPATYIFTALTQTIIIVTLEPCTLNAEFQHFILHLIKFPYFADTTERGETGPKTGWRQGAFTDNSNHMNSFHLVKSQNLTNYCCLILTSFALKLVLLTIVQLINKNFLSWSKRCVVLFWGLELKRTYCFEFKLI